MTDGIVYIMFLKGQRNQPGNKYVGATMAGLNERLETHKKNARVARTDGAQNRPLYSAMRKHGFENWEIAPLAELWLCRWRELFELEKYYIRLLKPDLNDRKGTTSDEECKRARKRNMQPWTCPTCLTQSRVGDKTKHRRTRYHRAIDNLLNELD